MNKLALVLHFIGYLWWRCIKRLRYEPKENLQFFAYIQYWQKMIRKVHYFTFFVRSSSPCNRSFSILRSSKLISDTGPSVVILSSETCSLKTTQLMLTSVTWTHISRSVKKCFESHKAVSSSQLSFQLTPREGVNKTHLTVLGNDVSWDLLFCSFCFELGEVRGGGECRRRAGCPTVGPA